MTKFKIGDKVGRVGDSVTGLVEKFKGTQLDVRVRKEKSSRIEAWHTDNCILIESVKEEEVGLKYDTNKPDLTLVTEELMISVAEGMQYGIPKYGRLNYRKFTKEDIVRFEAATLRHLMAHVNGNLIDEESKLPHITLVTSNLNIIMWLKANK